MSYFADLTPYTYGPGFDVQNRDHAVNIGWLDEHHEFEKGLLPKNFIEKFERLAKITDQTKGWHECPWCDCTYINGAGNKCIDREKTGTFTYVVSVDGVDYCCPALIKHYITEHQYLPPQEFIDVIMNSQIEELL